MASTPPLDRHTPFVPFDPEREELESVLASGLIDRGSNLGRLLLYICRKRFEGEAEQVKEFNIAMDVFGRSMEFDKRRDSIVRVEASRLRKKLKEYYLGEGRGHPIQIVIPPGQYVPRFVPREQAQEVDSPGAEPDRRQFRPRLRYGILALAGLLAALGFVLLLSPARRPQSSAAAGAAVPAAAIPAPELAVPGRTAPLPGDEVRILAGYQKEKYVDRLGRVWYGDSYFEGGGALEAPHTFLGRTLDPSVFQSMRTGGDFSYNIPLKPGVYELRLYFAETEYGPAEMRGGGEGSRDMNITLNGKPLLPAYDVLEDAGGPHIADIRVFKDISPASDGYLHLSFLTITGFPFVNAIEIVPGTRGRLRPIRIAARESSFTDRQGRFWQPDSFFLGGRFTVRREFPNPIPDRDFYMSERYGNFNYAIPVAPNGKYAVTLHFAETWFCGKDCGGGERARLFNVYTNGTTLLRNFDIYKEAGGAYRPVHRTFHGLVPNNQGKLLLHFEPVENYAVVNGIEVADESD
jgi:hypothetical protein